VSLIRDGAVALIRLLGVLIPSGHCNQLPSSERNISLKSDRLAYVVPKLVKQVTRALLLRIGVVELAFQSR
jgi:hypothetical protein